MIKNEYDEKSYNASKGSKLDKEFDRKSKNEIGLMKVYLEKKKKTKVKTRENAEAEAKAAEEALLLELEKEDEQAQKEEAAATSKRAKKKKYVHKHTHLFEECGADECAMYLQHKKQDKDPAMPKALGKKQIRCREWMHRPSPPSSPTHSEDEGDEQDSSADVAAALFVCIPSHSHL